MTEANDRGLLRQIFTSRLFHDLLIVCAVFAPIRFVLFPNVFLPATFKLPEQAYLSSVVALETVTHPNAIWWFVVSAAFVALHFVRHPKNPFHGQLRWGTTEAPGIRVAVLGLALPVAWKLMTFDVNLYFDRVYALDRVIIAALFVGMWRTPLAIPWFIGLAAAFMSQFHYPDVFHFTWADKAVLFYGLLLVWVAFIVSKVRALDRAVVPALLIAMFGSFYLYPGIAKVSLTNTVWEWFLINPVHDLFVGAWLNGWWAMLDYDAIHGPYHLLRSMNLMSTGFTMLFEFGIVVLLLHRRLTLLFLWAAVLFHTSVLLASGILFWEWWSPELAMLYLMYTHWKDPAVAHIYQSPVRWMSPLLIIFALPVFWPYALGWLDSPYNLVYDLDVQEEGSEEWIRLNRGDMDPYNLPFTQNRFDFLIDGKVIKAGSYGAITDPDLQIELIAATDPERVRALVQEYGEVRTDLEDREKFSRFLQRYFVHENARENHTNVVPGFLESLHHQYEHGGEFRPPGAPPVERVRMRMREIWHDGEQLHVLRDEFVLELEIPDEPPPIPTD